MTLLRKLELSGGSPSGFDYLRLILAIEVLIWHTVVISYGADAQQAAWAGPYRAIPALILPMFFALSGFLVMGSLARSKTISSYLMLRFLRVGPGLVSELLLTAFVMGPLVTTASLSGYFSNPMLPRYFLCLVGAKQSILPGVFIHNPLPTVVNGQFWTIPLEILCYIMLALIAFLKPMRHRYGFLALVLGAQLLFAGRAIFGATPTWTGVPAHILFLCFFSGTILRVFQDRIVASPTLMLASGLISIILIYIPGGSYFVAGPIAYFTISAGLLNPKRRFVVASGDYSYGIYLYAFPIQQLIAMIGPWTHTWYMGSLIGLPAAALTAYVSWHCLEHPALKLKPYIPAFDRRVRERLSFFSHRPSNIAAALVPHADPVARESPRNDPSIS